jgi:hypothetical protein
MEATVNEKLNHGITVDNFRILQQDLVTGLTTLKYQLILELNHYKNENERYFR